MAAVVIIIKVAIKVQSTIVISTMNKGVGPGRAVAVRVAVTLSVATLAKWSAERVIPIYKSKKYRCTKILNFFQGCRAELHEL